MDFLIWLENTALGLWVAQSIWGYPIVLSSHAVGMAIIVGTVVMISLRLLGFARDMPITSFNNLSVVAGAGVLLNVLSGLALFSGDPTKFFYHPMFWIKILLIILGALSVWWALRIARRTGDVSTGKLEVPLDAKVFAFLSLVFWPGAIIAGRLIAYMEFV